MIKHAESKCALCGKTITEKSKLISEVIDEILYNFDTDDCALMFKKFSSVYGREFAIDFNS
jgi:predicted nucleic acid-binding Zn ribbon protein